MQYVKFYMIALAASFSVWSFIIVKICLIVRSESRKAQRKLEKNQPIHNANKTEDEQTESN